MDTTTNWHSRLVADGARFESDGWLTGFGDPMAELRALQTAAVLVPLSDILAIEVSGDDAKSFLNTQLTSDVAQVTSEAVHYSGYCTPKGRLLATFLVCQHGSGYLLLLPREIADSIAKNLQRYVMRAKVKIALASDSIALLGVAGPASESSVTAGVGKPSTQRMAAVSYAKSILITLPGNRFLIVGSADGVSAQWDALSKHATPAGSAVWELQAIRSGVATVTAATQEAFIPQMLNLDRIGGVSFEKGCYPGQEIVARTHYLGSLKRQLYSGHSSESLAPGDTLSDANERTVGTVVNAAPTAAGDWEFLAVLQRDAVKADASLKSAHGHLLHTVRPAEDLLSANQG